MLEPEAASRYTTVHTRTYYTTHVSHHQRNHAFGFLFSSFCLIFAQHITHTGSGAPCVLARGPKIIARFKTDLRSLALDHAAGGFGSGFSNSGVYFEFVAESLDSVSGLPTVELEKQTHAGTITSQPMASQSVS